MNRVRYQCLMVVLSGGLLLIPSLGYGLGGVADLVNDPLNLVQNTATALRMWQSNANQALSLEHEVTQLANDAQNLLQLPVSLVADISATMTGYQNMLVASKGMVFSVQQALDTFDKVYSGAGTPLAKAQAALRVLRQASATATQAQSIFDLMCTQSSHVGQLLAASQASVGNLQVQQATNQLLGVLASQNAALQEMTAATGRGQIAYFMRQTTAEETAMSEGQQYDQLAAPDWDNRPKRGRGLPD